jgi:hypothetical protein
MSTPARSGDVIAFQTKSACFYSQSGRHDTLYFLPSVPVPELDTLGRPTLTLLKTPQTSILQLGAQLTMSAAALSTAAAEIARQQPSFASAQLQPGFVTVHEVNLMLADPSGAATTLKTSHSSGFPPYNVVFSVTLTPAQTAAAESAIMGRTGLLFVDYKISLPPELKVSLGGEIEPLIRSTDVANWFSDGDGSAHLQNLT